MAALMLRLRAPFRMASCPEMCSCIFNETMQNHLLRTLQDIAEDVQEL